MAFYEDLKEWAEKAIALKGKIATEEAPLKDSNHNRDIFFLYHDHGKPRAFDPLFVHPVAEHLAKDSLPQGHLLPDGQRGKLKLYPFLPSFEEVRSKINFLTIMFPSESFFFLLQLRRDGLILSSKLR